MTPCDCVNVDINQMEKFKIIWKNDTTRITKKRKKRKKEKENKKMNPLMN